MKSHLLSYLEMVPEDELSKMLNWAYVQQSFLDDKTSYEKRAANMVKHAIYELEKEK